MHGGGYGVEGVGGEIGAAVEHTDEGEGFGEYEGVGSKKEGGERLFEGVLECVLAGGILHYCSVDN